MTRNWIKFTAETKINFFWDQKLHKGRPRYKRSLQLSREYRALQNMKFHNFYFSGSFLPSWIRNRIPNTDPNSEYEYEFRIRIRINWPDWIRIQYRFGTATVLFSCARNYSSPCAPHWSGGGPVYAPILPSRAYDHTPAPSPPPHLARKPATDHVSTGTVGIPIFFISGGGGEKLRQDSNRAVNHCFWVSCVDII
jgi:hypothetical protein